METLRFKIQGISPLLMHNGQTADPANVWSRKMKEITSKRKKVDADYEELARLEWLAGLYLKDNAPCIPGFVFEAALIGKGSSARKERMGKEAAAAVWVIEDFPLEYDGPADPHELWEVERFRNQSLVRVSQSRVLRTRPFFKEWGATIEVTYDDELIDGETVKRWIEVSGRQVGLMDWRPKFGRFEVEWIE